MRFRFRHPGLALSLAFAAGLATAQGAGGRLFLPAALLSIGILFGLFSSFPLGGRRPWNWERKAARVCLFFLLGLWRSPQSKPAASLPRDEETKPMAVDGTVDQPPVEVVEDLNETRSVVTLFSIAPGDGSAPCQAICAGRLRGVPGGARVLARGTLLPLRGRRNPGDLPGTGVLFLHIPHPANVTLLPPRGWVEGKRVLGTIRERLVQVLTRLYPEPMRGFILSMVLGDRRLLSSDIRDALLLTGTYHLLAISGLHIVLIMAFVLRIPLPRPLRMPLRLLFLAGFTVLTGGSPPVTRSALMFSLNVLLERCGRRPRAMNTLGWTAFLLLAVDPLVLQDIGFQLSFVSVLSILTWGERLARPASLHDEKNILAIQRPGASPRARKRLRRGGTGAFFLLKARASLLASLSISLGTSAGTAPLILYYFQRVHPLGPVWNLLAYPLTLVTLVGGLVSIILGLFHSALGWPVALAVDYLSRALLQPLILGSKLPGSAVSAPSPPGALVALSYGILWAGLFPSRRRLHLAIAGGAVGMACLGSALYPRRAEIWTFDAGQGNAALLSIPGAGTFLIDAGALGKDAQAGSNLARAVLSTGHRSIDGVFLTHFHSDHVRGLEGLWQLISVEEIWVSPYWSNFPLGRKVLKARERGITVRTIERGHHIRFPGASSFSLDVLHPARGETLPFSRSANDTSLALRMLFEGQKVLFLGDLEEDGLARLFEEEEDLRAEILVAPHHGRANVLWPLLLEKVKPSTVIISGSGDGGAAELLERFEAARIPVHATWKGGAVVTRWAPGRGWITAYWRE